MKTRVFAVCAAVFLFCGIAHAGLSDGLVAYYPFNGNANDESGNGNNGTVNGATLTTDRTGNSNSSYGFNVSGYIVVSDSNTLDLTTSTTFSLWINNYGNVESNVLSKGATWSALWADYGLGFYNDVLQFEISNNANVPEFRKFSVIQKNVWTYITIVYQNSTVSFYENGVLVDQQSLPYSTMRTSSQPLYIGRRYIGHPDSGDFPFKGLIDDVRIYNRALAASEIQQIYQGGTCSNEVVVKPYTFTAGTPAKAAEINANFDMLYQRINTPRCTN